MNLYNASTGRYTRVPDADRALIRPSPGAPLNSAPPPVPGRRAPQPPPRQPLKGLLPPGLLKLGDKLPKLQLSSLETEDYILLLIIYLMYRESGDKQLLIMLAAMLFSD